MLLLRMTMPSKPKKKQPTRAKRIAVAKAVEVTRAKASEPSPIVERPSTRVQPSGVAPEDRPVGKFRARNQRRNALEASRTYTPEAARIAGDPMQAAADDAELRRELAQTRAELARCRERERGLVLRLERARAALEAV
jgi:hypothetical protein